MVRVAAIRVTVYSILSVAAVAVVWSELQPLFSKATGSGVHSGFLSNRISQLNTLVPVILSALVVGMVLWLLVVGGQEEKVRGEQPPRRPPR